MTSSKTSAAVGLFSLAAVIAVGLSLANEFGASQGLLSHALGSAFRFVAGSAPPPAPEMRSVGFFEQEANPRFALRSFAVMGALLSGVFAVTSARTDSSSLWYSLGVFASSSALLQLSWFLGVIFLVVFGYLVIKSRGGKMTRT